MLKTPKFRSKALTQSARDEACVCCGIRDGTVVWSHSNEGEHGKAMGTKAQDLLGNFLCMACHAQYDQGMTREEARAFFREMYPKTMVRVAEKLASGELKL